MQKTLKIVTRKSPLALWAANFVKTQLQYFYPTLEISILGITSEGDINLETSLAKIGGKGLFVKALEDTLLNGEADIAVHSLKDMPVVLPPGLAISAILEREDPRDALVVRESLMREMGFLLPEDDNNHKITLDELPNKATIGTSSLRRQSQVIAYRADLQPKILRGNVDTRVQKCDRGEYDAIILAVSGLKRLNLTHRISEYFSPDKMLPAVGQGALCIESRAEDKKIQQLIAPLNHLASAQCIQAERAMNIALGGSCQLPVAGFGQISPTGELQLQGLVSSPDGKTHIKTSDGGKPEAYLEIGQRVAEQLLAKGAKAIIEQCEK